jgi:hypothetical protein
MLFQIIVVVSQNSCTLHYDRRTKQKLLLARRSTLASCDNIAAPELVLTAHEHALNQNLAFILLIATLWFITVVLSGSGKSSLYGRHDGTFKKP